MTALPALAIVGHAAAAVRFVGILEVAVLVFCRFLVLRVQRGRLDPALWWWGFCYALVLIVVALSVMTNLIIHPPLTPGMLVFVVLLAPITGLVVALMPHLLTRRGAR